MRLLPESDIIELEVVVPGKGGIGHVGTINDPR